MTCAKKRKLSIQSSTSSKSSRTSLSHGLQSSMKSSSSSSGRSLKSSMNSSSSSSGRSLSSTNSSSSSSGRSLSSTNSSSSSSGRSLLSQKRQSSKKAVKQVSINVVDEKDKPLGLLKNVPPDRSCANFTNGDLRKKIPDLAKKVFRVTVGNNPSRSLPTGSTRPISDFVPKFGTTIKIRNGKYDRSGFIDDVYVEKFDNWSQAEQYVVPWEEIKLNRKYVISWKPYAVYLIFKRIDAKFKFTAQNILAQVFEGRTTERVDIRKRFEEKAKRFPPNDYAQVLIVDCSVVAAIEEGWPNTDVMAYGYEIAFELFRRFFGKFRNMLSALQ